jgi:hypothetical protein
MFYVLKLVGVSKLCLTPEWLILNDVALDVVNFHHGNMTTKPFMNFDMSPDRIQQAVPVSISHFQPEFGGYTVFHLPSHVRQRCNFGVD